MALPGIGWSRVLPAGGIGGVELIHLDLAAGAAAEAAALGWLDPGERARWRGLRSPGGRRDFALCRAALRQHLCRRLRCANHRLGFGAGRYGKPFAMLDGARIALGFNVSHGGAHGLIGLSPGAAIGVDIEEVTARPDLDGMAARVFGPAERAALASAGGGERLRLFYCIWVIKEAVIKALGTGFHLDPAGFEIPPAMLRGARSGQVRIRMDSGRASLWAVRDLGEARFAAALACTAGPDWPPAGTAAQSRAGLNRA